MTIARFAISLVLMAVLGAAQTRSPEAALGAAIHIEEVQGNYPAAIEAYKKFLAQHGGNRALAAKAQLRLGICYEKIGDAEARKAYERVLAAYGDQKETVAQARARLGALATPRQPAGFFQSQRILDKGAFVTGPPSRDGRYLPWGDSATGNLMLRDVTTGETRLLTTHGNTNWADWIESAVISPDGKRLAYSFYSGADLNLVNLDGTGRLPLWKRTARGDWAGVGGWTPDGKSVVFLLAPENGQNTRVGVVDVGTGQTRMLAPIKNGSADRISLSPDGRYAALLTRPGQGGAPRSHDIVLFDVKTEQETRLAVHPGYGRSPVFSPDSSTLFFVSDRRGELDLYAIRLRDGKPLGPEEPVKIGIGDVRLSGFTSNGTLFYSQSIRLTDIFTVNYDPAAGAILEKPVRLPTRISGAVRNPRYSPDGKKLLYSRGLDRSPSILVLRDLGSGEEREIPIGLSQPAFEWMPDSRQVLVARFLLNLETGAKSPLPFTNGLNGQRVLHVTPTTDANTFIVVLGPGLQSKQVRHKVVEYKLDSGATRDIYEAPADYNLRYSAISPDGKSLAVYEGEETENVKALVVIPMEGGKGRDLIRAIGIYLGPAQWTADSKSLLVAGTFLGEKPAIWLFPAGPGEKPRKLLNFDIVGTQMSLHPDGRTLAFHSGWFKQELWMATNVLPPR